MRSIRKGTEPRALREHRAGAVATYDNLTAEALATIRQALAQDQGYLCCYCMGRIDPAPDASGKVTRMKIEHGWPQSDPDQGEARALDFFNLLAACPGNQGAPPGSQHCDTRKGPQRITLDPRAPSTHPSQLRYLTDGSIAVDDPVLQEDLDRRLNLNDEVLKANRKEARRVFLAALFKQLGTEGTRTRLAREIHRLQQPGADGRLEPYVEVNVSFLRKRLR